VTAGLYYGLTKSVTLVAEVSRTTSKPVAGDDARMNGVALGDRVFLIAAALLGGQRSDLELVLRWAAAGADRPSPLGHGATGPCGYGVMDRSQVAGPKI
jgi:hypothetical protein